MVSRWVGAVLVYAMLCKQQDLEPSETKPASTALRTCLDKNAAGDSEARMVFRELVV